MMIPTGKKIQFDGTKDFKFIKTLGRGGTGDTHLFEDETTGMHFAIKKYSPKDTNFLEEHYYRFVEEIKILFNISHPNIVRIYNYYLYPEFKTGYLQMEYVDGVTIDKYEPAPQLNKGWDEIFTEVIGAFEYLESKNILHRDIRPTNILIDNDDNVKIIDFGFGKKLKSSEREGKSVLLNWPVTQLPYETETEGIYNHQTEIYFVGKLFSYILRDKVSDFKYGQIIDKMTLFHPDERYESFKSISAEISEGIWGEINFSQYEKKIYINFAKSLSALILRHYDKYEPITDINVILNKLSVVLKTSALENHIQDKGALVKCFIKNGCTINNSVNIEVNSLTEFYKLLVDLTPRKRKIVLDNLFTRLSTIKIDFVDDLPF